MKTFREYTGGDTVNPYYHSYAGSLLGPGLGQYKPVADLNAQKRLLGPNVPRGNFKDITKSDLDQIEKYADRIFGALDIDVEFTRHFLDRVNDRRNKRPIVPSELTRLFKQTYKKHGKTIRKLGPDAEAVISDMKTDINMPFVLNLKGGELELVAKTVMRKKDFKTSNPKLAFEDYSRKTIKVGEDAVLGDGSPHYALVSDREVIATGTKEEMLELNLKVHGRVWLTKSNVGDIVEQSNPRIPRKKGQPAGSDKHSDLYTDENPKGTIHGLGFKDVATAKASVSKIEGSGKSHAHKIQAAIAMEQRAKVMGKKAEAAIYRAYIEKMKKKTKEMQKEGTYFTRTRSNKSRGQIMKKQLRPKIEPLMRDIGFKRGSYKMEPSSDANQLIITVDKSDLQKVKKTLEPIGLSRIIQVVSEDMQKEGIRMPDYGKQLKRDASKLGMKVNFTASGDFILLGKDEQTAKDHEKIAKKLGLKSHSYGKTSIGSRSTISKTIPKKLGEDTHGFKCPSGYKFDKKLMACIPIKSKFKTQYAYPYFFGGNKSGDQSGQTQNGNGNGGNGNGNAQGGNGNGNGGNGNGGNGS